MLAHRLRRWPNIEPALGQRLVFARMSVTDHQEKDKCSCIIYVEIIDLKRQKRQTQRIITHSFGQTSRDVPS